LLANGLEWFAVWFAKLGNGLAELTNQLVTLAIFIMGFVIWFAVLANWLALLANGLGGPAVWYTALGNGVVYGVRNLVCWAHKLALLPIKLAGFAI